MVSEIEQGLHLVVDEPPQEEPDRPSLDAGLAALASDFVEAFNARDLEAVLSLVAADVECPDADGPGAPALAEELTSIWERSPGALLTAAVLDDEPCAVAWLPEEDGCWRRATLVRCAAHERDPSLLGVVALVDDPDGLERAETADPTGEELDEGSAWVEWTDGEDTAPAVRR